MGMRAQAGPAGRIKVGIAIDDEQARPGHVGQHGLQRRQLPQEELAGPVRQHPGNQHGRLRQHGGDDRVRGENGGRPRAAAGQPAAPAPRLRWPGSLPAGCPRAYLTWQTARVSSDNPPDLHMLNVIVRDMAASLDFYQRLGTAVPGPGDDTGAHVQLKMPGGFSLELDTAESARLWHAGWRADPASAKVVLGFMLPTRQAVDD